MISKKNQLELRQIRYFLMLANVLHYRKAAELLYISQSALSQQIKLLELSLGTPLFDRSTRRVSLNRAGQLFVREAQLIIRQLDDSLEQWQLEHKGLAGQLKIGFVGSAMQAFLPPILKQFGSAHPSIQFHLGELTNLEQIKALEENTIDIGFVRSNQIKPAMRIRSVYKENFSLVLPRDHPITADTFRDLGQFAKESFILFPNDYSQTYYQQILDLCSEYGFSPHISHKAIYGPAIFKLVENHMGIAIVPSSLKDIHNYKIRFIELSQTSRKTELFAVWKKNNRNPSLTYFMEMI